MFCQGNLRNIDLMTYIMQMKLGYIIEPLLIVNCEGQKNFKKANSLFGLSGSMPTTYLDNECLDDLCYLH